MRKAILAAALLVTAGCGAYQFPGGSESPTPAMGTVSGRVIAVPCAPVEQPGKTCTGRPVPNLELDYIDGRGGASRTVTDAQGNYSINLKPASYAVKISSYMRVISGPLKLQVDAGSSIVANYVLDSGIRVPVQQE
jgi:hypothetical protein